MALEQDIKLVNAQRRLDQHLADIAITYLLSDEEMVLILAEQIQVWRQLAQLPTAGG